MNLESNEAALVLADEWEEQGDPRAELTRAQVNGLAYDELLRANWTAWVGALAPKSVLLRWKWGHLIEAGVGAAPTGWTPDDLLGKPTAEFLSRLALAAGVSSRGLERARGLRHLVCFGALESEELPSVETLTLDLAKPGLLASLVAPRLTALHTRVAAQHEGAFFRSLSRARWWPALQTWTHRVTSPESLTELISLEPLVARRGAGLLLLCDARVLTAIPLELQRALPLAKVTLLPTPEQPRDPEDFHGPMLTHAVPTSAPMDFRSRAAAERSSTHGIQSDEPVETTVGSGVPLGQYRFSTCGWCGSANTLGIYSTTWSLYSQSETTRYADWEYECHDCGLFTGMRRGQTH